MVPVIDAIAAAAGAHDQKAKSSESFAPAPGKQDRNGLKAAL
jgi:hypothetical protein